MPYNIKSHFEQESEQQENNKLATYVITQSDSIKQNGTLQRKTEGFQITKQAGKRTFEITEINKHLQHSGTKKEETGFKTLQSSFKDNICEGCEGKIQLDGISDPIGFELYNNDDGISIFIEGQEFTFSGKEFTTMTGNEAKQKLLEAIRKEIQRSDLAKKFEDKQITSLSSAISRAWVHSLNATDILTSQDKTVHDLATLKGLEDIPVQEKEVEDVVVPQEEEEKEVEDIVVPQEEEKEDEDVVVLQEEEEKEDENVVVLQEEEEKEDVEFVEKTTKKQRISSGNSIYNENRYAKMCIDALFKKELISSQIYNEAIKDPVTALEAIERKLKISQKDLQEVADEVLLTSIKEGDQTLATPTLLANYYERTTNKLSIETMEEDKIQETKQNLETVKKHMEDLLQKFVLTGALDVYSYTDTLNIGDVYEGYIKMAEIVKSTSQDNNPTVEKAEEILKDEIEKYDQLWGLDGIEQIDSAELTERFEKVSKLSKDLQVTDETMALLSKVTFKDKDGNTEPQFIDADGNETATFTAGCTIKPESKLSTIIDFARNNTVLSNLTTDPAPTKEDLEAQFQFHVYKDLYAVGKTEEAFQSALKGLGHTVSIDDLDYSSVEKIASSVKQQLENSENLTITDAGFKAAIETEVNNTMMCIDRVGTKLNNKASLLLKRMHDPIAKHDEHASQRFESNAKQRKDGLINWVKTAGITAATTFAMKGGTYVLAKYAGVGVPMAAGILATSISVVGLGVNYSKYQKKCKTENKKPTLREFFSPKSSEGRANIATCLGCAAGACMIAGQPVAAAVCGVAALGINGSNIYKTARESGATKRQAWGKVLSNLTAVGAGIALGNAAANAAGFNNFTKTETKIDQKEGTQYTEEEIQHAKDRIYEPRWNDSDQVGYIEAFDSEAKVDLALQNIKNASMGNPNLCNIEGVPNAEITLYSAEQVAYAGVGDKIPAIPTADGSSYTFANYMADLRSPTGPTDIQAFQDMAQNVNFSVDPATGHVDVGIFGHEHNGIRTLQPIEHSNRFVTQQIDTSNSTTVHIGNTAAAIFTAPKRAIQKLKERIGALADKRKEKVIEKTFIRKKTYEGPDNPVNPVGPDNPVNPVGPDNPVTPEVQENPKVKAMIMDEYKIVYGIEPNEASYESYYARVEKERLQQTDPKPEMTDFLTTRKEKLDKIISRRGMDDTITEKTVRGNLMQSNITAENFSQVITLSHFTKWAEHVVAKNEVTADGSRSLRKGPVVFKSEDENKKVVITDVNKYLVEGKELTDPGVQHTVARRDIRVHIANLEKTYDRQRQLSQQQRSR